MDFVLSTASLGGSGEGEELLDLAVAVLRTARSGGGSGPPCRFRRSRATDPMLVAPSTFLASAASRNHATAGVHSPSFNSVRPDLAAWGSDLATFFRSASGEMERWEKEG
ncbi:hypothetical protein E2562_019355 [Oryza meyeriana var. granulata]|uniref:Uncharacterized protein n=1 Tax=Oryza meyeriana var. granulata TaxID=110450 RepID=A0A6G1BM57_9ORYZ|nr:hypothetical protein E2562_019355 [Oryza meyeriana var. granulata]